MKLVRTLLTLLQSPTVTPPEPPPVTPSSGGGWAFPQFQPYPTRASIVARVQRRARIAATVAVPPATAAIRAEHHPRLLHCAASANLPQFAARISAQRAMRAAAVATVDVRAQLERARTEDQHLVGFLLGVAQRHLEPWNPGTRAHRDPVRLPRS